MGSVFLFSKFGSFDCRCSLVCMYLPPSATSGCLDVQVD